MSIRATATIAFFFEPFPFHILVNFASRTGSFRIAIQEFSMRADRMSPEPMPVMRPLRSVSPVEYSLQVSPTKEAIFFPLVKRETPCSKFEDEADCGEPPDPGQAHHDMERLLVSFLGAKGA